MYPNEQKDGFMTTTISVAKVVRIVFVIDVCTATKRNGVMIERTIEVTTC
jgi:hypothetical protein